MLKTAKLIGILTVIQQVIHQAVHIKILIIIKIFFQFLHLIV